MHRDLSLQGAGMFNLPLTFTKKAARERETQRPLSRRKTTLLIAALRWRYCQIAILEAVIDSIQRLDDWN